LVLPFQPIFSLFKVVPGHFREDNGAKNCKNVPFSSFLSPFLPAQKPLSVGCVEKYSTTCCGSKKNLQKSYDNDIRTAK